MTCRESREYLYAFLDSELDAPLSMELQRHLEHCPDCARESEIERHIHKGLAEVLAPDADEPAFSIAALEAAVGELPPRRTGVHRRRPVLVGLAAMFAALALTLFMLKQSSQPAASSFAQLVVADFEHTLQKEHPVEFASNDPAAVGAWLQQQTGMLVSLPPVSRSSFELLGGRKCSLSGHTAAFTLYRKGGELVSLVVVPGDAAELIGMQRREAPPQHWIGQLSGKTVVAWQNGPLVYATVSALSESELVRLIPNADEGP